MPALLHHILLTRVLWNQKIWTFFSCEQIWSYMSCLCHKPPHARHSTDSPERIQAPSTDKQKLGPSPTVHELMVQRAWNLSTWQGLGQATYSFPVSFPSIYSGPFQRCSNWPFGNSKKKKGGRKPGGSVDQEGRIIFDYYKIIMKDLAISFGGGDKRNHWPHLKKKTKKGDKT